MKVPNGYFYKEMDFKYHKKDISWKNFTKSEGNTYESVVDLNFSFNDL